MAKELRATEILVLAEEDGPGIRATEILVLAEEGGPGSRATEILVLVEEGALGTYATEMLVLVEMEIVVPCHPSAHYLYNDVDISAYINSVELEAAIEEVETTRLSDTAKTAKARLPSNGVSLSGDWSPVIDAILGFDAMAGRKRSGVAQFDDCDTTVTLTWAEAFISNWQVKTQATGKIEWSAKLRHNGSPTRATAAS